MIKSRRYSTGISNYSRSVIGFTKFIMIDTTCAGCSAEEGKLHRWGCDNEDCPFCSGQLISCDCFQDMMDWAIQTEEPVDLRHFTEAEKERWLELIGNLKYQWEVVVDSPFDTIDMLFESPPYWCRTKTLLKAFWKIQKKFIKLDETLDYKWEEYCAKKGRIPHLNIPQLCPICGKNWPDFFQVPDDEWKRYIIPVYQDEIVCFECYEQQKSLFRDGWEKGLSRIPKQYRNEVTMTGFMGTFGYKPVCRLCGGHNVITSNISKTDKAKYLVPILNKGAICLACFDRMRKLFPDGWKNIGETVKL
jgi:hypothetical protein